MQEITKIDPPNGSDPWFNTFEILRSLPFPMVVAAIAWGWTWVSNMESQVAVVRERQEESLNLNIRERLITLELLVKAYQSDLEEILQDNKDTQKDVSKRLDEIRRELYEIERGAGG
jgi:hypothetical protein